VQNAYAVPQLYNLFVQLHHLHYQDWRLFISGT